MKMHVIYFVVLTGLLQSCNKEKNMPCFLDTPSAAGSYHISAIRYKASLASAETDYFNQYFPDPCQRDDFITFNANGSFTLTDAGVTCIPSGNALGAWSLSGTVLFIDGTPYNVENFSCTEMTISFSNKYIIGDKLILIYTRH